ncbi:MAG: helix-turn-helix transcriptional regulator [Bacteroidetes bacterium]|jgi:transcriptional regulator with XRE-family HTH domain|nr:helix-turn-helix transcriptional regulator [Bacteroidota bacterium]MBT5530440.1 helix-turn-helix transcriptional regulator [Cytophagia bacterium]MBT3802508.1 helix-turn-helix transcriptional regulator [Bacteroidota bacterium]MBT4337429.1 helix-turn-helix transcriptional regulator [Bacteroidota bacterium]MBT4727632.1 helix-turn-helix transcriptional regulator [Bacteroidota bacterium]
MEIQQKFGKRLKELRLQSNLSQEALALKAEIDRTYMTSVENGKRNISIKNIYKILTALDISFFDFFNSKDFN